ncbi:MAG: alpha/beta hydrolase family protein [Planctomycetota bacterium]
MRRLFPVVLATCALALTSQAQQYQVGFASVQWSNFSGSGSPTLDADVHYPALQAGGPVVATAAGLPVVVFLHGYGLLGSDYAAIGDHLASYGYVSVMLNTAQFSYLDEVADARAMFDALTLANGTIGGPFEGRLDMSRIGLMGHSMGGAVVAYVVRDQLGSAANNPGYRCALALAPVDPQIAANGIEIRVPVGIVSGAGDLVTPPPQHASLFYAQVAPDEGLKFHYEMDAACGHMNLVGLDPNSPEVFVRMRRIAVGFFDQFLDVGVTGLESILGTDGASDPRLMQIHRSTVVPQMWIDGPGLQLGDTTGVRIATEPGFVGLAASDALGVPLPSPYGTILVDPATSFLVGAGFVGADPFKLSLTVPNNMALVGVGLALQCAGATINEPLLFGSAFELTVGL